MSACEKEHTGQAFCVRCGTLIRGDCPNFDCDGKVGIVRASGRQDPRPVEKRYCGVCGVDIDVAVQLRHRADKEGENA